MNELAKIYDAMLSLKGDVGEMKGALKANAVEYAEGKRRNIETQTAMHHDIKAIKEELAHKMDEREYKPLLFLNTVLQRPRLVFVVLLALGGGGTITAVKWEQILRVLGMGQ